MTPLRTAIVGAGNIAGRHAASLHRIASESGEVALVGAADPDPARLSSFAAGFDIPATFTSVDELFASTKLDLVHICAPPSAHVSIALAAMAAGAHVVVEKPATLTLAEFDRLVDVEKETGRFVATVSQHRFGSGALRLRELVQSGVAGRPLLALCNTVWYRNQEYFDVEWRGRWDTEGGGPTMGHGIHQVDLMLSALGEWTEVNALARQQARVMDTEDLSLAHVTFASGAVASVVNSVLSPREETYLRFDFEYATVEVTHLYSYTDADWRITGAQGHEQKVLDAWERGPSNVRSEHLAQFREVIRALRSGTAPPVTTTDARSTLQLIAGIYASAFDGRPVTPPDLGSQSAYYQLMQGDGPQWRTPKETSVSVDEEGSPKERA